MIFFDCDAFGRIIGGKRTVLNAFKYFLDRNHKAQEYLSSLINQGLDNDEPLEFHGAMPEELKFFLGEASNCHVLSVFTFYADETRTELSDRYEVWIHSDFCLEDLFYLLLGRYPTEKEMREIRACGNVTHGNDF